MVFTPDQFKLINYSKITQGNSSAMETIPQRYVLWRLVTLLVKNEYKYYIYQVFGKASMYIVNERMFCMKSSLKGSCHMRSGVMSILTQTDIFELFKTFVESWRPFISLNCRSEKWTLMLSYLLVKKFYFRIISFLHFQLPWPTI